MIVVMVMYGSNALVTTSPVCDSGHLSGTNYPGMILLLWLHRMPLWQHDMLLWLHDMVLRLWLRGILGTALCACGQPLTRQFWDESDHVSVASVDAPVAPDTQAWEIQSVATSKYLELTCTDKK